MSMISKVEGMRKIVALLLLGLAGCRHAGSPVAAKVPEWVDEPGSIMADGSIRAVGFSDAWLQSDSTRRAAELDAERRIAKVLGGSQLWASSVEHLRDHPVLDESARELGLGEKFLGDLTYSVTSARIPSLIVQSCWRDSTGQRGGINGYACVVAAPGAKVLAAMLDAKASGLRRRAAELKQKEQLSDEAEVRAQKAVELLIGRARELESRDDAVAR